MLRCQVLQQAVNIVFTQINTCSMSHAVHSRDLFPPEALKSPSLQEF